LVAPLPPQWSRKMSYTSSGTLKVMVLSFSVMAAPRIEEFTVTQGHRPRCQTCHQKHLAQRWHRHESGHKKARPKPGCRKPLRGDAEAGEAGQPARWRDRATEVLCHSPPAAVRISRRFNSAANGSERGVTLRQRGGASSLGKTC
jgi:hypothetical protein